MQLDFVEEFFRNRNSSVQQDQPAHASANVQPSTPRLNSLTPPTSRPTTPTSKYGRKRNFKIFVDSGALSVPLGPASQQRLKRTPLAVRVETPNSTPIASPRIPDMPFPRSHDDSFWEDKENWDPMPPATPPPTPVDFFRISSPAPGPPPPPSPPARIERPRRMPARPPPRNMVLYGVLGLSNWNVSKMVIERAWRHTAREHHPDKVAAEEREAATAKMQQVNAAKEVLTDPVRRCQYHEDGVLPWVV
ncbi:DnaJ-domain-containing protein [Phaeosphaeriaceae sp. SRC1lsM3a]|nr:DnaJ-domain-containing protein [Stagonospora sp. SRC1lsM3a]